MTEYKVIMRKVDGWRPQWCMCHMCCLRGADSLEICTQCNRDGLTGAYCYYEIASAIIINDPTLEDTITMDLQKTNPHPM